MSYVPSDFDDLEAGFNLLNVVEPSDYYKQREGEFTDKGLGYKQQYQIYSLIDDHSNTTMDFCYIFKGTKPKPVAGFHLVLNTYDGLDFRNFIESINLDFEVPYTITQDSFGNEVWLYEGFNFSTLKPFDINDSYILNNRPFAIEVLGVHSSSVAYWHDIASFGKNGYNGTTPTQQPIVLKYVELSTLNNFTISRKDNISELMEVEFSGTFDNQFLGAVDNTVKQIMLFYINPNTQEITQKILEKDVDYKVVENTFYSGNGNSMQPTDINIEEMYYQGMTFTLDVETWIDVIDDTDETYDNEPVFNWGRNNNTKFLNVNGELRINDEPIGKYSTSEIKTGEIWIDNKPIYSKVIVINNQRVGVNYPINHNIANISNIIDIKGIFNNTGIKKPYPTLCLNEPMFLNVTNTQITFEHKNGEYWSENQYRTHIFIIKYTKTTD